MATQLGLRERKKQLTRRLILDTAQRLFAERGFDAVTVAEVARAADISEVTVFNYFPTKEDLFFGGMFIYEEQLVEAVRRRPAGESIVDAFRRTIDAGFANLDAREAIVARAARMIGASASLQVREREIVARYTEALALLIAEEQRAASPDVEAWGVASALMGTHRALVAFVRAQVLAGRHGRRLIADARAQADRAFSRLEDGLAGYSVKSAAIAE